MNKSTNYTYNGVIEYAHLQSHVFQGQFKDIDCYVLWHISVKKKKKLPIKTS